MGIAEGTLNLKSKNVAQAGGGLKSKFNRVTKEAKLQIWLFNDVIVSLKSTKSKKRTNVASTKYTWPLQLVWLKDNTELDPSDPKMPHSFVLVGPRKSYTLRFADVNEKRTCYTKIKETVDKTLTEEIAPDDVRRYGTFKFADKHGPVYEGWWNMGRIHGHGTLKVFGNTYTGEWEYNRKHGFGSFHSVTGAEYTGEWKEDRPHGAGDLSYPNGDRYEGEWEDGYRHGKGNHFYANGDCFVGEWSSDVPSGSGTFSTTTGIVFGRMESLMDMVSLLLLMDDVTKENSKMETNMEKARSTTTMETSSLGNGYETNLMALACSIAPLKASMKACSLKVSRKD